MDHGGSIQDWDEDTVQTWLASLGCYMYEQQIREHRITGDILCMLQGDSLKEIGISSIGHRLAILKAVYLIKIQQGIPVGPDDYVPPSAETEDQSEQMTLERLHEVVREQVARIDNLERENQAIRRALDEIRSQSSSKTDDRDRTLNRQPSFKWAQYGKPTRSPTKATPDTVLNDSPHPSPQRMEHEITVPPPMTVSSERPQATRQTSSNTINGASDGQSGPSSAKFNNSSGIADPMMKSFKVSLEDPAWKVLPAALKKYKINNDDWQNYAMFICYGSTERCLSYDEKPLLLFQKLKEARKNPVFMLKHIKDIRSPIAVAQQKQAARKTMLAEQPQSAQTSSNRPNPSMSNSTHPRGLPGRLQMSNLGNTPPLPTAGTAPPHWPELASPALDRGERSAEDPSAAVAISESSRARMTNGVSSSKEDVADVRDDAVTVTGISYAVAIYPYLAEKDDEFDVSVGDRYIILSRARGWWVVQRDPTGAGVLDNDSVKQGWVPAGCLLETSIPVASAISEAMGSSSSPPLSPVMSRAPILPTHIVSTSFPGVALMEYRRKGEEELDLNKDDSLRVFKRYNHWSYAVKEENGDRGWVPSWFIGKVSSSSVPTPATPTAGNGMAAAQMALENDFRYNSDATSMGVPSNGPNQFSPLSSVFPPPQKTVI